MDEVDLDAYGRDYRPEGGPGVTDLGIRASDRYVGQRDLLRGRAAGSGAVADVQLGVDPGTFYCGDQLAALIALAREHKLLAGFIHVPPDRSTSARAAAAVHLHARGPNLEQCARVVAVALRGMVEETCDATIVLTGFGPFLGVADNPTTAFVSEPAHLERALRLAFPDVRGEAVAAISDPHGAPLGLRRSFRRSDGEGRIRLVTAVLALAASPEEALAGRYFDTDTTAANFRRLIAATIAADEGAAPAGVISLGVDSGQIVRAARPAFRIETQTRGFHSGERRGRTATDGFQRTLELARIFMRARSRGDDILSFDEGRPRPGDVG